MNQTLGGLMKKYINYAFIYAILGLASGVFYREFTKFHDFTGKTALSVTHVHFLTLGTLFFLITALFVLNIDFYRNPFRRHKIDRV